MKVTKEFVSNFTVFNSKVGVLELPIYPEVISVVTEIPRETILEKRELCVFDSHSSFVARYETAEGDSFVFLRIYLESKRDLF